MKNIYALLCCMFSIPALALSCSPSYAQGAASPDGGGTKSLVVMKMNAAPAINHWMKYDIDIIKAYQTFFIKHLKGSKRFTIQLLEDREAQAEQAKKAADAGKPYEKMDFARYFLSVTLIQVSNSGEKPGGFGIGAPAVPKGKILLSIRSIGRMNSAVKGMIVGSVDSAQDLLVDEKAVICPSSVKDYSDRSFLDSPLGRLLDAGAADLAAKLEQANFRE